MLAELKQLIEAAGQYEHLTFSSIMLTLLVSAFCGVIIYLTYRFFHRGVVYSENFGVLIVLISVVTGFIIITIGANIVLSLGMVGALSIVRFRAAVKDPLDVGFLYWAVGVGLAAGGRLHLVALAGTAFIALLYIGMTLLRLQKRSFLLILCYEPAAEKSLRPLLNQVKHKVKNKTIRGNEVELTAEVKIKGNETDIADGFGRVRGVSSAVLVEYTGDYN